MKCLLGLGVAVCALVSADGLAAEAVERIVADDSTLADNAAMKLRPSYQDCLDNSFIDQYPRLQCAEDEYGFQDARLNAVYKSLMQSLPPLAKSTLRAEERTWIRKRGRRCDFGIDPIPDYAVEAADCQVREAAKRATALERRLSE